MFITPNQKPLRAILTKMQHLSRSIQASVGKLNRRHQWIAMMENYTGKLKYMYFMLFWLNSLLIDALGKHIQRQWFTFV